MLRFPWENERYEATFEVRWRAGVAVRRRIGDRWATLVDPPEWDDTDVVVRDVREWCEDEVVQECRGAVEGTLRAVLLDLARDEITRRVMDAC